MNECIQKILREWFHGHGPAHFQNTGIPLTSGTIAQDVGILLREETELELISMTEAGYLTHSQCDFYDITTDKSIMRNVFALKKEPK